jgi:Transposase DDE domain
MIHESLVADDWANAIELLGGERLIEESARQTGAFERPRKVKSATDLLRLTLAYCVGQVGTRLLSGWAAAHGIADISNVSLWARLRNTGDWLAQLIGRLLKERVSDASKGREIRILDATSVAKAGKAERKNNGLWRVHCSFALEKEEFDFIEVTDQSEAELIDRVPVIRGEIRIGDRGYLQADRIGNVLEQGGDVLIRAPWNNVRWRDEHGEPTDIVRRLEQSNEEITDFDVWLDRKSGEPLKMRLVALRKSEGAANEARRKIKQEAKRKGRQVKRQTLITAGFVILVSSLGRDEYPSKTVLELYRMRWRIELAFKRLKSLVGLRSPPSDDLRLAKPWILAHFLVALLTEPLIEELGVSPS